MDIDEKNKMLSIKLKRLREASSLPQRKVAAALDIDTATYSKIETGRADISGEKLKRLAVFYNISADYILGLTDVPRPLK
jgi:transcriptional regulator with XRE-family HTH domain